MIESIGKNVHFKSAPVAAVLPPMDRNVATMPVPPIKPVSTSLERSPSGDMVIVSPDSKSPRETYQKVVDEQQRGAEAAFRGLTTSSALVQSAERGNRAASKQLDIMA